jgi:hypothetical protein
MILTRYLSSSGWVEECSHQTLFNAYVDARRRCVVRGCPYVLFDADTGSTLSVLTVKQCLHQYGVDGELTVGWGQKKPRQGGESQPHQRWGLLSHFVTAIHQNRTLAVLGSSVVLHVLLAAIGQGHDGFLEASSGPRSMAWVELRLTSGEVNVQ